MRTKDLCSPCTTALQCLEAGRCKSSEQEADLDRACKNATERMEAIRAKKPAPAAPSEKNSEGVQAVFDNWNAYLRPVDRADFKAQLVALQSATPNSDTAKDAMRWQFLPLLNAMDIATEVMGATHPQDLRRGLERRVDALIARALDGSARGEER